MCQERQTLVPLYPQASALVLPGVPLALVTPASLQAMLKKPFNQPNPTPPNLAPFYPTQAWLLVYVDNTPKVANKLCADRSSTIDCSSSLMIRPTVNRRVTAESSTKASLFSVHFFFISFLGRHRPAISDMHTRSIKMLGSLGRNAIGPSSQPPRSTTNRGLSIDRPTTIIDQRTTACVVPTVTVWQCEPVSPRTGNSASFPLPHSIPPR